MTCPFCRKAVPAGEHFCPNCGRPTSAATPEERARWEVLEWRRVKEAREAQPGRTTTEVGPPPEPAKAVPTRNLRDRLSGLHARREARPAQPAVQPSVEPEPQEGPPVEEPAPSLRIEVSDPAPADPAAAFLIASLRDRDVYVDAGARTGRYALLAAAHVGAEGRVIAIEADAGRAERLGALRERGASQLQVVHARLGRDDLPGILEPTDDEQPVDRTPIRRLDALLREIAAERVDFLRIDVAGAAADVLAGAKGLLQSPLFVGPVMIQIDVAALAARAATIDDVLDHFPRAGWADSTGLRLGSFTPTAPKHVRVFERRV